MNTANNLELLNNNIKNCCKCPRLVVWRETVALEKKKAYKDWEYWGKPVPGFGDISGRILVVGLAPGAHGSNRTGRMFTGDASGDFLFPALYKAGFANQPASISAEDKLELNDLFITAVCRCAPPQNKPNREEQNNCRDYLDSEFSLMPSLQGIVALGSIAFFESISLLSRNFTLNLDKKNKFIHGKIYFSKNNQIPWLIASYHPSRQNTQTGRLTETMFADVWATARKILE